MLLHILLNLLSPHNLSLEASPLRHPKSFAPNQVLHLESGEEEHGEDAVDLAKLRERDLTIVILIELLEALREAPWERWIATADHACELNELIFIDEVRVVNVKRREAQL